MAVYALDGVPFNEAEVTGTCTFSPSPLVDGITAVTVTYTDGNGVTVTATQPVTITHKLVSIAVTSNPTKTTYEYGDTLATAGLVVTATYTDSTTATVTGSCSPTVLNTVGSQAITVTYSENGVTKTTSFSVTVNRKTITEPSWKGTLTYTGSQLDANNTALWNNYNTSYMTIGGVTLGTNAGSYNATFTPGANYRWPDGTTTAKTKAWTIVQANGSVSLSRTSVAIDATNYNSNNTVTVTRAGIGAITVSGTPTGLTITVSGTTITVKGNGSTPVSSTTITVNVAADGNYKATSTTFTVSATYFDGSTWLKDTEALANAEAVASATEWANFKNWVKSATTAQLQACMGKYKKIQLTSNIQGATTHLVMAVGYNCDRDKNNTSANTITFHTANMLPTLTVFGSSNGYWNGSTVRSLCQNYYNALPFKASVCTVSKGTCTSTNSSQTGTPTYQDETVFLPSDCEMGFPAGHDYSNGKGYAASYNEFCQQNTSKTAYQWYNSNTRRIKKQGDSGSAQHYWERSLRYNVANFACFVFRDGMPDNYNYDYSYGFAPAFVI